MSLFQVGDTVSWFSCSAGIRREKRGKVIQVIAAGNRPPPRTANHRNGWGQARKHESYLVRAIAVGTHSAKIGKHRLYWPLVALLVRKETP